MNINERIKKNEATKVTQEPCLKEHNISLQCLDDNAYNKDQCALEFENYSLCKRFWSSVKADRIKRGIRPDLPPPEERDAFKRDHFRKVLGQK